MTRAVYPGTFDPVTQGHLDIVRRAATLFDEVIVAVAKSSKKSPLFSLEERLALVKADCAGLTNVTAEGFTGLLADFCRRRDVAVVVRSARNASDYEYEVPMALMNRRMAGVETVFLTPTPEVQHISGTLVREIASLGGDVSDCVTRATAVALTAKFQKRGD